MTLLISAGGVLFVMLLFYFRLVMNDARKMKGKKPCPRCGTVMTERANFCPACGLMLVSHYEARTWMEQQGTMLAARQRIADVERAAEAAAKYSAERAIAIKKIEADEMAHEASRRRFRGES